MESQPDILDDFGTWCDCIQLKTPSVIRKRLTDAIYVRFGISILRIDDDTDLRNISLKPHQGVLRPDIAQSNQNPFVTDGFTRTISNA